MDKYFEAIRDLEKRGYQDEDVRTATLKSIAYSLVRIADAIERKNDEVHA